MTLGKAAQACHNFSINAAIAITVPCALAGAGYGIYATVEEMTQSYDAVGKLFFAVHGLTTTSVLALAGGYAGLYLCAPIAGGAEAVSRLLKGIEHKHIQEFFRKPISEICSHFSSRSFELSVGGR